MSQRYFILSRRTSVWTDLLGWCECRESGGSMRLRRRMRVRDKYLENRSCECESEEKSCTMMCWVTESNTYLDQQHAHGNRKSAEKVKSSHESDLTKMATASTAPAQKRDSSTGCSSQSQPAQRINKKQTSNTSCFQQSR